MGGSHIGVENRVNSGMVAHVNLLKRGIYSGREA